MHSRSHSECWPSRVTTTERNEQTTKKKHVDFDNNACVSLASTRQLVRLRRVMRIRCVCACAVARRMQSGPRGHFKLWSLTTFNQLNYIYIIRKLLEIGGI